MQERELRRRTSIRVAHNSTWIENRILAIEQAVAAIMSKAELDPSRAEGRAALEVRNYFEALELIDDNLDAAPDEDWMRRLHACIMRGRGLGRPRERSEYRRSTVQVGNFTYVPPAWEDVPALMSELADWATKTIDKIPDYLFAAILAYQFVTIHPFQDGNGRTCRALATWALRRHYDPKGLLSVEDFYVRDLEGYYDSLQMVCTSVTTMRTNAGAGRTRISPSGWTIFVVAWPRPPNRCEGKWRSRLARALAGGRIHRGGQAGHAAHPKLQTGGGVAGDAR